MNSPVYHRAHRPYLYRQHDTSHLPGFRAERRECVRYSGRGLMTLRKQRNRSWSLPAEYLCLSALGVSVGSKRRSVSSGRAQASGTAVTGRHRRCISSRTASGTRWCLKEEIRAVAGTRRPPRSSAQCLAGQLRTLISAGIADGQHEQQCGAPFVRRLPPTMPQTRRRIE